MQSKIIDPKVFFMLVFALLQLNSCKKDPCETINCLNGGVCYDGSCDCPDGYSGTQCETYDECFGIVCLNGGVCNDGLCDCPDGYSGTQCETYDDCFGIVCLNNGVCVNGICNCPEGYTGSDCSQQVTPNKIKINKIVVKDFPQTDNNGAGWDLTSGADIYPVIYDQNSNLLYPLNISYYENANPSESYDFDCIPTVDLNDPYNQYSIDLMDYDQTSSDDFMGGLYFTPYNNTNGFPSVLTYSSSINGLSFDLHVTYTW
jgi:hypothetical protein